MLHTPAETRPTPLPLPKSIPTLNSGANHSSGEHVLCEPQCIYTRLFLQFLRQLWKFVDGEGSSCEQQLNNWCFVSVRVEEIRVFQAYTCGWRCDTKCGALARTRKCAFFLLVSVPCLVASANAISQDTFCHLRHVSVLLCLCNSRLQSAYVFAFSLLSSSTFLVWLALC